MLNLILFLLPVFFPAEAAPTASPWASHGPLQISPNGHYLEHEDGTPFLWMGDTGWGLFGHLDQAEVIQYLDKRQKDGFSVIQSVAYWYPHGGNLPDGPHNPTNAYGHRPFEGEADGPNTGAPLTIGDARPDMPNDYWDHADFVVREIQKRNMYLALLPCWGSAYIQGRRKSAHLEFTTDEARSYGRFLGQRYADMPHIIWILGGDIDPVNHGQKDQSDVYRAMAEGIAQGVTQNDELRWDKPHEDWDKVLMSFHAVQSPPHGRGGSSSIWFHEEPWLDINMMETWAWPENIYPLVLQDYQKMPYKPTIMGEGAYEYGKYLDECGWVTPRRVRQQAYHTFFAGAAGHTYGAYAVWPMRGMDCGLSWQLAIQLPGATQVAKILPDFLQRHRWWHWQASPAILVNEDEKGEDRKVACQSAKDEYLVYFPQRDTGYINLNLLQFGQALDLTWFRPENGEQQPVKEVVIQENLLRCAPPKPWEDAILIIKPKS